MMKPLLLKLFAFCSICILTACGSSGGGGNDPFYPGGVAIEVNPGSIDTGERAVVTGQLVDPNPEGVILKFRLPTSVSYVDRSSTLVVDGVSRRRDPDKKGTSSADSKYYLIFILDQADLESENYAEVKFFVRGDTATEISSSSSSSSSAGASTDARIEIDADIKDPGLDDDEQFSLTTPKFTAEDGASLKIR